MPIEQIPIGTDGHVLFSNESDHSFRVTLSFEPKVPLAKRRAIFLGPATRDALVWILHIINQIMCLVEKKMNVSRLKARRYCY